MPQTDIKKQPVVEISSAKTLAILEKYLPRLKPAVKRNNRLQITEILSQLAIEVPECEFQGYLLNLKEAVETDRWNKIGDHFLSESFIHNRIAALIAPYRRRINGEDLIQLTLIGGEVCPHAPASMEKAAIAVFGKLNQPIPKLILLKIIASEGNISGQEAFIAPGGWMLPNSEQGVSILCVNLHRQRYNHSIRQRIQRIFEPETASLILSAINDTETIVQEYYQHESGHALGLGLDRKIQFGLVNTPQQAGLEEFKTDIGGFRIAAEVFSAEDAGKLVACTLNIRWGIDFCRPGAPLNDHDAISSLLILDRLLQSGEVYLTGNRLLALRDVSFEKLFRATEIHRLEAEELVREELARLDDPTSIVAFYEGKTAHPDTISLHREFINRCSDLS